MAGMIPVVTVNSTDTNATEVRLLVDTGANVSIISASILKPGTPIEKGTVQIASSTGDCLPVKGRVALSLVLNQMVLPCLHFWVTTRDYGNFHGIIGTDILASLDATINCQKGKLVINPLRRDPEVVCYHMTQAPEAVHKLKHTINSKQKRQMIQVVASHTQFIPANSQAYIECRIRQTPYNNFPHIIVGNTLHASGVVTANTLVTIGKDGTFDIPVVNLTDRPYKVKDKDLLTLANPFLIGSATMEDRLEDTLEEDERQTIPSTSKLQEKALIDPVDTTSGDQYHHTSPAQNEGEAAGHLSPEKAISQMEEGLREGIPKEERFQESLIASSDSSGAESQALDFEEEPERGRSTSSNGYQNAQWEKPLTPPQDQELPWTGEEEEYPSKEEERSCGDPQEGRSPTAEDPYEERDRYYSPQDPIFGTAAGNLVQQFEYLEQESKARQCPARNTVGDLVPRTTPLICQGDCCCVRGEVKAYCNSQTNSMVCHENPLVFATQAIVCEPQPGHEAINLPVDYPRHGAVPFDEGPGAILAHQEELKQKLHDAVDKSAAPDPQRGELRQLLLEFIDIFRQTGDRTHVCPLFEQAIPVMDDKPVTIRQYPLPRAAREALEDRVQEFLDAGIIRPSKSEYLNPIWMVKKKDGTWRMCVDFRELNKKIPKDSYPLPRIDEIVEEFREAQYMTCNDMFWGFYHIKLKDEDIHKTAFSTGTGCFEFVQMPMGLKTAPAAFQRLMNLVFKDYLGNIALAYMDDLIIYSKTAEKHVQDLTKVFVRMREAGLRFKIEKCNFFQKELRFLGVIISPEGVRLDPDKVKAVNDFPRPDRDVGQLQSFLGLVGYFKRHIPGYAAMARPLYEMLRGEDAHKKKRKGVPTTPYKRNEWGPLQEKGFQALKEAATTAPVLVHPDFTKPFILTADASAYAIGYVLSQIFEDGEHPVAYGSRLLKGPELRYPNTDREMLAPVEGVRHFRSILYGRHFTIRTDNTAFKYIAEGKPYGRRTMKWLTDMEEFSYDIEHVSASKLRHADALSRIHWPGFKPEMARDPPEREQEVPMQLETPDPVGNVVHYLDDRMARWAPIEDYVGWSKEQKKDPDLRMKYRMALRPDEWRYCVKEGILFQQVDQVYVPIVPPSYRTRLLYQFHGPPAQGHLGPERTYLTMKQHVFWPGMKQEVEEFVKSCDTCQRHKRNYSRVPMQHQTIPSHPFETCTMDLIGKIPTSQYGEEYILVMQDMLTRWVELAPIKIANADTVIDKFMTYWVSRYGPPKKLLTDRGSQFTSSVMEEFSRLFDIEKVHTIAYRPQSNGANERMHQELTKYFSMYLDNQSKGKWRWLLRDAAWANNSAYHTALGMSPYEALFGHPPPLSPLGIPRLHKTAPTFRKYYGIHRKELMSRRRRVQEQLLKHQHVAVDRHNRYAHEMKYRVGDLVLYKNMNPKTKYDQKYIGPWPIVRVISPVSYELGIEGKRHTVHATQIKAYRGPAPQKHPRVTDPEGNWESDEDSEEDPGNLPDNEDDGNYIGMIGRSPMAQLSGGQENDSGIDEGISAGDTSRIVAFRAPINPNTQAA